MNYVISNFTEYKFVLSENKKDVFQAHFTVLHCYDNLCTDYFERNLSFISDKKKTILFEVGGEVVAKSVLECTQYSECRGRRLATSKICSLLLPQGRIIPTEKRICEILTSW